jgi:hypothetical protein
VFIRFEIIINADGQVLFNDLLKDGSKLDEDSLTDS